MVTVTAAALMNDWVSRTVVRHTRVHGELQSDQETQYPVRGAVDKLWGSLWLHVLVLACCLSRALKLNDNSEWLMVPIIPWFIRQLVLHQAGTPFCHESVGLNTSSRHRRVNIIKTLFVISLQACWPCCKWHLEEMCSERGSNAGLWQWD